MNVRKALIVVFVCMLLLKLDSDTSLPWLVIFLPLVAIAVLLLVDILLDIADVYRAFALQFPEYGR